jgi:transcriptional regulator with XRE-family HTH domain
MVGQKKEVGATGEAVARNVKRLREAANLTYTEVSKALAGVDRPMSPLAVRRIEEMERRVDVDDLLALAIVLGVTPISLLYPGAKEGAESVTATGLKSTVSAEHLWEWMRAEIPLVANGDEMERYAFLGAAMPEWRRQEFSEEIRQWSEIATKRGVERAPQEVQDTFEAFRGALKRGAAGKRGPDGDD